MDTIAYIAVGVAVIVGLVIGLLVSPKRKAHKGENENMPPTVDNSDTIAELQNHIQSLQARCDELKQTADSKSVELANLQELVISGAEGVDKDLILKIGAPYYNGYCLTYCTHPIAAQNSSRNIRISCFLNPN